MNNEELAPGSVAETGGEGETYSGETGSPSPTPPQIEGKEANTGPAWRDVIDVHPAAELVPSITGEAFNNLIEDIRRHFIKEALVFNSERLLIDGRHRLTAVEEAIGPVVLLENGGPAVSTGEGLKPLPFRIDDSEPYALVVSLNAHRRHFNNQQKRDFIAKLLKANPERSDNATAKLAGASDKTVTTVRTAMEANSEIPDKPERPEASGRNARGRKPRSAKAKISTRANAGARSGNPARRTAASSQSRDDAISAHCKRLAGLEGDALADGIKEEIRIITDLRWNTVTEFRRAEIVLLLGKMIERISPAPSIGGPINSAIREPPSDDDPPPSGGGLPLPANRADQPEEPAPNSANSTEPPAEPSAQRNGAATKPAEGIPALLYWMGEREAIRQRRAAGDPPPWTDDLILRDWSFCNVRREDDRVTRWIAANWREPHATDPDLFFAMCVARFVNWPDTLATLGFPVPWDAERFLSVMAARKTRGEKCYHMAYRIRADNKTGLDTPAYQVRDVFNPLWEARERLRPKRNYWPSQTLAEWHRLLSDFHGLGGGFMSGQVVADIKYVAPLRDAPDWMTFVVPGPGSEKGLNHVLGRPAETKWRNEDHWRKEFRRLEEAIAPELDRIGSGRLSSQDLQNCLCEFSKYKRGKTKERFEPHQGTPDA
jgi:ParB-like chromosome segregation protein Spo0J